jgi:endo-1,3-1,4-beta-glycanase ExoK
MQAGLADKWSCDTLNPSSPARYVVIALGLAALLVAAAPRPPATGVPFTDRFASLNEGRWAISNGWSNGISWMLNDWQASQVRHTASGLEFTLGPSKTYPGGYKSGEMQSRHYFMYGYFEVEMQTAKGDGTVNGFFTYTGAPRGRPWNEIDVEVLGRNPRAVQVTTHTDAASHATTVPLSFDSSAGQHIYAIYRQPDVIRWYVDGIPIHEESGPHIAGMNEPQQLIFNLWASNSNPHWSGHLQPTTTPVTATVRCIAYSRELPTTPLCEAGPH